MDSCWNTSCKTSHIQPARPKRPIITGKYVVGPTQDGPGGPGRGRHRQDRQWQNFGADWGLLNSFAGGVSVSCLKCEVIQWVIQWEVYIWAGLNEIQSSELSTAFYGYRSGLNKQTWRG